MDVTVVVEAAARVVLVVDIRRPRLESEPPRRVRLLALPPVMRVKKAAPGLCITGQYYSRPTYVRKPPLGGVL